MFLETLEGLKSRLYLVALTVLTCIMVLISFREVHEEASEAREKTSELKLRRQEQAASRREKLKQAYLRKRVENLKAASKSDQT